jgi:hypothetical protein
VRIRTIRRLTPGQMLKALLAAAALTLAAGATQPAAAHKWDDVKFGLGAVVGMPTGVTFDILMGRHMSTNLAVGMGTFHNDPYVHLELRLRLFHLSDEARLSIPVYLGAGGYIAGRGQDVGGSELNLGARFPIGIAFELRAPVQFFVEGAVRMHMLSIGHTRSPGLDFGGAAGFRIYF